MNNSGRLLARRLRDDPWSVGIRARDAPARPHRGNNDIPFFRMGLPDV